MTFLILAAIVLSSCFAADHPFFESRHVAADDRLVGEYRDAETGTVTTVAATRTRGRYRVILQENGARSVYVATHFRAGNRTFLDLAAEPVDPVLPPDAEAPVTQVVRRLLGGGRHVVLRVQATPQQLLVWSPTALSINALLAREPALVPRIEHQVLRVFPASSAQLHAMLERQAQDDALFSQELVLIKSAPTRRTPSRPSQR